MDVKQGFLERSNFSPFRGMVELVDVMRANESYQKVLQTFSDITSRAINDVGRLR
jgi:flagellar basal body rod protein FlgG